MTKERLYFPNLNGIRALAALSVVVVHIHHFKYSMKLQYPPFIEKVLFSGNDAVTMFFVLSGFLITYLLLVEHQRSGTIAVRDFYARRILRIWPVYYAMLIIGFGLVPLIVWLTGYTTYHPHPADPTLALLLSVVWLPNAVNFFTTMPVTLLHLWTVGIEEQFYLVWPVMLRKAIRWLPLIVIGLFLWRLGINQLVTLYIVDSRIPQILRTILAMLNQIRIENMAVGGLAAYLLFHNQRRILDVLFHPVLEKIFTALIIIQIILFPTDNSPLANMAIGIPYAWFILNLAGNPRCTLKLEHPILHRLGLYSYGIYMYHQPVNYLVLLMLVYSPIRDGWLLNLLMYTGVIGGTVAVAALSYHRLEQPFLNLKRRFTRVESSATPALVPPPAVEMTASAAGGERV